MTENLILFIEPEDVFFDLHVVDLDDGDVFEVDFGEQLVDLDRLFFFDLFWHVF